MLKFLITGDLQCHNWRQFSYTLKNGMNSRLANCLKVFDVLLDEAKKREIDKVVINGDVFEDTTYIEVEVFDGVYRKLEKLHSAGIETVINIGNHDVSKQSGRRILHALRAFRKVATIVEKPTLVWKHLFVVPWSPSSDSIKNAIRSCSTSKETCLILHTGVQGATTGPTSYLVRNPIKLADVRPDEFGLVLLSDYHTRQRLASNVWYLGSPLQHSFGEIHRPCIWSVSLDREGIFRTEKVYTSFPRFRRWNSRTSNLRDLRVYAGDYVRVDAVLGSDGVSEDAIRRLSRKYGFLYQIRMGQSDAEESVHTESMSRSQSDVRRTFRKYVQRTVKIESKQERLLELGQKLYRGEM